MSSIGLTDERILELLTERLDVQLNDWLSGQSQTYAGIKAGLETMLRSLSREDRLTDMLQA